MGETTGQTSTLTPKPMRRQREARNPTSERQNNENRRIKRNDRQFRKIPSRRNKHLVHLSHLELKPAPKTETGRGPNYFIYAWGDAGVIVKVGGAWIKTMVRGSNAGDEFITLTIDDPSLRQSLNVAAFKNAETGNWDIIFRRRQDKAA